MAGGQIAVDDPRKPDVRALLERHLEFALGQTPPEHSFALDLDALLDPAITFFSFRADGALLGIGAIRRLSPGHAEIKSMHTGEAARGRPGPRHGRDSVSCRTGKLHQLRVSTRVAPATTAVARIQPMAMSTAAIHWDRPELFQSPFSPRLTTGMIRLAVYRTGWK